MRATVHPPAPSRALVRIREAIGHCRHAGIAVRIGAVGVVPAREGRPAWELTDAMTVDPIGAALIAWQPMATSLDDAAALAIGCPLLGLVGIRDGLYGCRPGLADWQYTDGYATGLQLRAELLAPKGALRVVS